MRITIDQEYENILTLNNLNKDVLRNNMWWRKNGWRSIQFRQKRSENEGHENKET